MTNQRCVYNYHSNRSITYYKWNNHYKVIKQLSASNVSLWCEANQAELLLVNSLKISSNKIAGASLLNSRREKLEKTNLICCISELI